MVIYALLLALVISFTIHIIIIVLFAKSRNKNLFNWFLVTTVSNMALAITLSVFALSKPDMIRKLNLKFFMWLLSGFISMSLFSLKINIFRRIYKRTKDPEWFHLNYFGKKVYEKGIVKQFEFLAFIISFPFFLFLGAYFVARLINLIMFGHI